MLGIELGAEFAPLGVNGKTPANVVVVAAIENGLLTVPAGPSVIRWLPPLIVTRTEIDEAVSIFAETLDQIRPR